MTNNFFVYGTLQTECSNHRTINPDSIENIQPAIINNMKLHMYNRSHFPCMIDGDSKVIGEVITIKESELSWSLMAMDRLEGYYGPDRVNFYDRKIKNVELQDGTIIEAYTYIFNDSDPRDLGQHIKNGDFKSRLKNKKLGGK